MAASRWARQNPREAAAWAWNSGDAGVRQRSLKEVLEVWAGADRPMRRLARELPPSPNRDQAILSFVTASARWAPDIAAREALLIENGAARAKAVNNACRVGWKWT